MRSLFHTALFVAAALCGCHRAPTVVAGPAIFYVAPDGDDASAGTVDHPFASLSRARDAVVALQASPSWNANGAVIRMRGGTYELTQPVVFAADPSVHQAPITIEAQPGEAVHLRGGHALPAAAFSPVTDGAVLARLDPAAVGNVLVADLPSLGITSYGEMRLRGHWHPLNPAPLELFFDGTPMTLARWPNDGLVPFAGVVDAGSVPRTGDTSNRGGTFSYSGDRPLRWSMNDVWVTGFFHYPWADDSVRIAALDTVARTITLADPHLYGLATGQPLEGYYVENLLEELDAPGEWYLDRDSGRLYLWPPAPPDAHELVVSMLEGPLLSIEGASDVVVRNLTLEYGRGMAVYIDGGSHNRVDHCTIQHFGTVAVAIGQGIAGSEVVHYESTGTPEPEQVGDVESHLYTHTEWNCDGGTDNGVVACDLHDLGAGGVMLGGGDRPTLTPSGNFVTGSDIADFNRRSLSMRPAVYAHGVGLRITNNRIHHFPQVAIRLEGNDHVVESNEIADGLHAVQDMGAIYLGRDPSDRGNLIRWNYLHDLGGPPAVTGVYLDDGESGADVVGNVFYRVGAAVYGAVFVHGGDRNPVHDNVFIECPVAAGYVMMPDSEWLTYFGPGTLWERRLKQAVDIDAPPFSTRYPELVGYYGAPRHFETNAIDLNVAVNCGALRAGDAAWSSVGTNLETTSDPGFVDGAHQNWALAPDSPVFARLPGFVAIPFAEIGPQQPPGAP